MSANIEKIDDFLAGSEKYDEKEIENFRGKLSLIESELKELSIINQNEIKRSSDALYIIIELIQKITEHEHNITKIHNTLKEIVNKFLDELEKETENVEKFVDFCVNKLPNDRKENYVKQRDDICSLYHDVKKYVEELL